MNKIVGRLGGSYSSLGKTLILQDAEGNDLAVGIVTKQEQVFNATPNDVREGFTYAGNEGIKIGSKNIPSYRTHKGGILVMPNEPFSIVLEEYNKYDYTKFQCIISKFNTTVDDSVITDRIAIGDNVYNVNSLVALSTITKNSDAKSIDLNIVNDTEETYIIHYFTYREET